MTRVPAAAARNTRNAADASHKVLKYKIKGGM